MTSWIAVRVVPPLMRTDMSPEQVFRQTCVLRRNETAVGSDGLSRLEVIEMEDRRQVQVPGRPPRTLAPPPSKSQLIVHCDDASASHNNGRHTASASCDSMMFDVV